MKIVNGMARVFYWPLCRAYARRLGDRPADRFLRLLVSVQFWRINRFWPDFVRPRRFSERVWSLQLHSRDSQLTLISDKLRVRDYVAAKECGSYLVPLLWSGTDPEKIPFDVLPQQYVLKTNHGCGYLIIVKDKAALDRQTAIRQMKEWLAVNFCQDEFLGIPWAYKNIVPAIMAEAFLEENGKAATDYKFWCFGGRVECISVHFDRFERHSTLGLNRDFECGGGLEFDLPKYAGRFERPGNYREMVQVAETLAQGFEFMRVDLYNIKGRIYFGELTPYPGGVEAAFKPEHMDYALGEKWARSTGQQKPEAIRR